MWDMEGLALAGVWADGDVVRWLLLFQISFQFSSTRGSCIVWQILERDLGRLLAGELARAWDWAGVWADAGVEWLSWSHCWPRCWLTHTYPFREVSNITPIYLSLVPSSLSRQAILRVVCWQCPGRGRSRGPQDRCVRTGGTFYPWGIGGAAMGVIVNR